VLGPLLVGRAGLGLLFVPLTLVAIARVDAEESGVASSVLNAAQQVGGAIGLAVLGTVAWTTVANNLDGAGPEQPAFGALQQHALAAGYSGAFLIGAAIMLLALALSAALIRVRRIDILGGTDTPQVVPSAAQP
jgi:hypothetical protein